MKEEKLDFDENNIIDLLNEALYFINGVPNKKYKVKNLKNSYELASKIEKYLKEYDTRKC